MVLYIALAAVLLVLLLAYFRLADRFNIIDKPNQRSSHTKITIRGGGIVFSLAVLLWFLFYGFAQPMAVAGLLAIAVISFMDDVLTLSGEVRILVHLLAVSLLFISLGLFALPWWVVIIAYIITIGWINAFNFMDGINGITVLYALVSLLTFYYLSHSLNLNLDLNLLTLLVLSTLLFSWFNLRRRARCFAGDVGSVSMAFVLAWLMLTLMLKTGRPEYILFFAVYGLDSVITILYRLSRKENIFEAHRTHLYQYLSNELKWPHVLVAAIYAGVQLLINGLVIYMIQKTEAGPGWYALLLLLMAAAYLSIRYITLQKIRNHAA